MRYRFVYECFRMARFWPVTMHAPSRDLTGTARTLQHKVGHQEDVNMLRSVILSLGLGMAVLSSISMAGPLTDRAGWSVHQTAQGYDDLIASLKTAVKAEGLIVVTQAGPTKAAAARGITIPRQSGLGRVQQ